MVILSELKMKKCCSCFKPTSSMHGSSDDSGPSALPVRPCSSPSALPSSGANRLTRRFWGRIIRVREERADPNIGRSFTFRELDTATGNFSKDNFLGQGGFGKVYRGRLSTGEVVAVKTLNSEGFQGVREFAVEVDMLTRLSHPHLVKLIGYCVDGHHRLVVYEYLPLGSLEDHLFDVPPDKEPLDWNTRMKIAAGAAVGLEYLHKTADPPVIYRDVKCSNVLLDHGFYPKLSDFGLARQGPTGDQTHVTTRVMGTYGYCAPEYVATSKLTFESDIYSFGILLLEIINGGRVNEDTRPARQRNLVEWARQLSTDPRGFPKMADPRLQGRFPVHGLMKVAAMALVCVSEQAKQRPKISEVVKTLTLLASQTYDTNRPDVGESSAAAEARMSGRRRGLDGRESPATATATASQAGDLDNSRGKRPRYIDIGSNSSD